MLFPPGNNLMLLCTPIERNRRHFRNNLLSTSIIVNMVIFLKFSIFTVCACRWVHMHGHVFGYAYMYVPMPVNPSWCQESASIIFPHLYVRQGLIQTRAPWLKGRSWYPACSGVPWPLSSRDWNMSGPPHTLGIKVGARESWFWFSCLPGKPFNH